MTEPWKSLAHSRWECKYHVVFVPQYRRKAVYGEIRACLGGIFHELARQKECRIVEGHLLVDHVHMCIEIPPKHAVAYSGFPCPLTPLIRQRGTKLHEWGAYPGEWPGFLDSFGRRLS